MTSAIPHVDPYYEDEKAEWLRDIVERCLGIRIFIVDTLRQDVMASRDTKTIWIKPGLPFDTFRELISNSVWFIRFGTEAAPMFTPAPTRLRLAASNGVVFTPTG